MADHAALKHPLRHPAEIPTFVIMVILNVVILGILFGGAGTADKAPALWTSRSRPVTR